MKRRAWLILMPALWLGGCKRDPGPNPERRFTLYDIAWRCGQRDRLLPQSRDWQRYRKKLVDFAMLPDREAVFAAGYEDGFDQHPDEPVSDTILDYDREFRRGRTDAWAGKDSGAKTQGYRDGHEGRKHTFGRGY